MAVGLLAGRWGLDRFVMLPPLFASLLELRFLCCVLLVALCLSGSPRLAGTRRDWRGLWLVCLFLAYLATSTLWSPAPLAAASKVVDLAYVFVFSAIALVLSGQPGFEARFWRAAFSLAVVLAIIAFLTGMVVGFGGRLAILAGGPITLGRILGLGALLGFFYFTRRDGLGVLSLLFSLLALLLLVLTGSRGPLLSLMAVLLASLVWTMVASPHRLQRVGPLVVVGAFLAMGTSLGRQALGTFRRRIVELTLQEQYDAGRSGLYAEALDLAARAPLFGHGLQAFQVHGSGVYPHNLFLEVLVEGGLLGVVLLVVVLASGALRAMAGPNSGRRVACFFFFLLAAQVSGELFDNRMVFVIPFLSPAGAPLIVRKTFVARAVP